MKITHTAKCEVKSDPFIINRYKWKKTNNTKLQYPQTKLSTEVLKFTPLKKVGCYFDL